MTDAPLLRYRQDGPQDAPALVLGPALGTTFQIWHEQIPDLSRYWRVIRYDLPGHGGSVPVPTQTVEEIAVLLLELLEALGVHRFGYAGVGLGGSVGALLALSHPHRIVSLALVGTSAGPGSASVWREHAAVIRATGVEQEARTAATRWFTAASLAEEPALAEPCAQMVRTVDKSCYAACCDAMADHDLRGALAAVAAPTLVIAGAEDAVVPPGAARELTALIPDSRLAVVPNAAHLANLEQPGPVTQLLLRHFAATLREAPRPPELQASPSPEPAASRAPDDAAGNEPVRQRPVRDEPVRDESSRQAVDWDGVEWDESDEDGAAREEAARDRTDRSPAPAAAPRVSDTGGAVSVDGLKVRREVLGDLEVDSALNRATDLTEDFEDFVTRYAWGEIWARPGLERRVRAAVSITALVAGGHLDELEAHVRAGLRSGLTIEEIREVLMQTAVYCGVPAARAAFAVAQRVFVLDD
ncbi:3-oxoadipate enol-lactonase [Wenjunlia vitaminophila]|uniref:3-oxoadipate enol-lactonase n=1 Tax=Wenjunlia vitaminophila TaxID=76728 RepID=A0A0T6LYV1_WENVI|nr:alpha/beta fold hydrolase [Wenjunlia vitaminophila]KRV51284.1 3-oxoadipate enol-lactonase [Wenjunlia vitaminophila]